MLMKAATEDVARKFKMYQNMAAIKYDE